MKKNMFRSKFLQAVFFIFSFLCFSPQLSYATAPKSVDLVYDMNAQTLSVKIIHDTSAASRHYIKYVEIKKNGTTISKNKYDTQSTGSILTYTYNIAAKKGDVFEVTAICNIWGHKTSTLVVVSTKAEKPVAQKNDVAIPRIEEPVAPEEAVATPIVEEPAAPKEEVITVFVPAVTDKDLAQVSSEQVVRNLVIKWVASWESGDMKTYRSCYASDFQSKGMNLNAWISYKTYVHKRSKNININIDDLQISADGNNATAVFTQNYSSSTSKDSGKKTLKLRKINDEWKIYKENI